MKKEQSYIGGKKLKTNKLKRKDVVPALESPVWDFCRFAQRTVHTYSTLDFKREHFIPDL